MAKKNDIQTARAAYDQAVSDKIKAEAVLAAAATDDDKASAQTALTAAVNAQNDAFAILTGAESEPADESTPIDETVPGGRYVVNGVFVDANGNAVD